MSDAGGIGEPDKNPWLNLCGFGRFLALEGMIIGYARVSTDDQNLNSQTDVISEVSAERIFSDKVSGSKRERSDLDKMPDRLRDGDFVIVTKYDR